MIITWTEVAERVRLYADVRSHLSGSSAIQPLAASEESWHRSSFFLLSFFLTGQQDTKAQMQAALLRFSQTCKF